MSILILLLAIMFSSLMTSCRSTKSAARIDEQMSAVSQSRDSGSVSSVQDFELIQMEESIIREGFTVDFTLFSPPDSAGRQHVKAKGKAVGHRDAAASKGTTAHLSDSTSARSSHRDRLATSRETHGQTEDSKSSQSSWRYYAAGILLGCMVLFYLIRYRRLLWLH